MTTATVQGLQERLERAIAGAARSDDRALAGRVRDDGHRLMSLLNGLIHSSRLYTTENHALDGPAAELSNVLRSLIELLGSIQLVCVEDQVYVNDVRIRVRSLEQPMVDSLRAELARHDVGAIAFQQPLDGPAVKALAAILAGPGAGDRHRLSERIRSLGDVELAGPFRFQVKGEPAKPQDAAQVVTRAAQVAHRAVASLAAGRLPNPLPVRRAVMDLLPSLGDAPPPMLDPAVAATLPPAERHLLAVCHLALVLGRTLGLADGTLSDLGVSALLHDVGAGDAHEPAGHALTGARRLMRQRGFHEAKIRRLLAVLDHHRPHQAEPDAPRPSLFARILHIADDFDSLSADRFSRRPPVSPATAIAAMWAQMGTEYDPDLLAVFVGIVGRYPPGTLLELGDGRWVVTLSGARDRARFAHPVVRVVREGDGTAHSAGEEIDLGERPDLWIVRVVEPERDEALGPAPAQPEAPPLPPGATPVDEVAPPPLESAATTRQGDLHDGVWPLLLKDLHLGRESGRLKVAQGKEFRWFRLEDGEIVDAWTNVPSEQFGAVLFRLGYVEAAALERSLNAVHRGAALDQTLLRLGAMDAGALAVARAAFVRQIVAGAFEQMDGTYSFERQPGPHAESDTHEVVTGDLILESVRRLRDPDVVRYGLGDIDRVLSVSRDPRRQIPNARLRPSDAYVMSRVDGSLTGRELLNIVPLPREQAMRSLLALLCLGAVEYRTE